MITVFHKGDAPQIIATLRDLGIAHTEYDLRACPPEAGWAAAVHLREIGRTRDLGDGSYEMLTPTTTVDNQLGRAVIAGDYPETVLGKLPHVVPAAPSDRPAPVIYGVHEQRPDGRCSCKTDAGAQVLAEVNVTEPRNGHPWEPTDAAGNTHPDAYWEESDA